MTRIEVIGLTAQQIANAIQINFPDISTHVTSSTPAASNLTDGKVFVVEHASTDDSSRIEKLEKIVRDKENQMKEMEKNTKIAMDSIRSFRDQQQQLYNDFMILHDKYDCQKNGLIESLWNHCSPYHPYLRSIPSQESQDKFVETEDRVGNYDIQDALGEGQFATVFSCVKSNDPDKNLALKVIKKERVLQFASICRVSNEIEILKKLNYGRIIKFVDCIHTKSKLYIITEKGGQDLFDFMADYPEGVSEDWACAIISGCVEAVYFIHSKFIAHRDLKPENILLEFNPSSKTLIDLKLCDFGLATKYDKKTVLSEFCGSPGFFAPEMLTESSYAGDKVDIWSIGSILLELAVGHEIFCDIWMSAYDYEVMKDKDMFGSEVSASVQRLEDLHVSAGLKRYLMDILKKSDKERPTIEEVCRHQWVSSKINPQIFEFSAVPGSPISGKPSPQPGQNGQQKGLLQYALSNRERKQLEEYNKHQNDADNYISAEKENFNHHHHHPHEMALPPIEPSTPDVVKVRKIFKKGDEMADASIYQSPLVSVSEVKLKSPRSAEIAGSF